MSNVTLILVAGRRIHFIQTHWRTIKDLLEYGFEGVSWKRHEAVWDETLDAGYILVDLNRKLFVNGQEAFAVDAERFET